MKKFVNNLYKNQALFYKVFLFALTAVLIVYLLPKGGNFKYEIPKGKPWQYENLYAPFDFAILKSEEEIKQERQQIRNNHTPYFQFNQEIPKEATAKTPEVVYDVFSDSLLKDRDIQVIEFVNNTLEEVYEFGLLQTNNRVEDNQLVYLRKGNEAFEIPYKNILWN